MADLGSLLQAGADVATGGALGLLGNLANRGLSILELKQRATIEREIKTLDHSHQIELAKLTGDQQATAAAADAARSALEASFAGLQKSIDDQTSLNGRVSPWAADALAFMRPAITLVLVGLAAFNGGFLQLAGMAVAWWFGDRQHGKGAGR